MDKKTKSMTWQEVAAKAATAMATQDPSVLEKHSRKCGVNFVGFEAVPLGPDDEGRKDYGSKNDGGGVAVGPIVRFVYVCKKCHTSFSVPFDMSRIPTGSAYLVEPFCPEGCNKKK